jgi:hypothetical protein
VLLLVSGSNRSPPTMVTQTTNGTMAAARTTGPQCDAIDPSTAPPYAGQKKHDADPFAGRVPSQIGSRLARAARSNFV